jgi:tRNA(Arg) A34 adenosine deaminase TadA
VSASVLKKLMEKHLSGWENATVKDEIFMHKAFFEAKKAFELEEVPVGAVIVDASNNTILSTGFNETNLSCNATR